MKERPILFSAPMVRALLAGTKTQTRRGVRPQPSPIGETNEHLLPPGCVFKNDWSWPSRTHGCSTISNKKNGPTGWAEEHSPYGQPGENLRVKEQTWIWCRKVGDGLTKTGRPKFRYLPVRGDGCVVYCADGEKPKKAPAFVGDLPGEYSWRCKVARFMPAWASRITLEIIGIRVERLDQITDADALAEGVDVPPDGWGRITPVMAYMQLWDRINGPGATYVNPWVWVIEFRRLANPKADVAPASGAHVQRVVGCESSTGEKP